jgi:TatD DNase family protein
MMLETDCPFLAPHPHRGRRNEPAYVRLVASKIAALKEVPIERVAEVTTANAAQLFGFRIKD